MVDHKRAPQRRRAQEIAWLANRDTPYDQSGYCEREEPDGRDVHLFLLWETTKAMHRGIGLLIAGLHEHIWPRQSWEEWDRGKKVMWDGTREPGPGSPGLVGHPPIWTVERLWLHQRARGQGLAQRLADAAVRYLGMTPATIGWSAPFTASEEAFVRRYCPKGCYIVA